MLLIYSCCPYLVDVAHLLLPLSPHFKYPLSSYLHYVNFQWLKNYGSWSKPNTLEWEHSRRTPGYHFGFISCHYFMLSWATTYNLPLGPQMHSSFRLMPLPGMPSFPVDNAQRSTFSACVALTHPAPNLGWKRVPLPLYIPTYQE